VSDDEEDEVDEIEPDWAVHRCATATALFFDVAFALSSGGAIGTDGCRGGAVGTVVVHGIVSGGAMGTVGAGDGM